MHIPMMMLVLTAFDTKCTVVALQPRPQRTTRMMTSRFSHDSGDVRVRLAVLETNMNSMGKTLERIELSGKTEVNDVKTEVEEVNGKVDQMIFWLTVASMGFSNSAGLGVVGPLMVVSVYFLIQMRLF
jgi:hypothetical protein